ncbi:unnamed protein product [Mytilus coruscus]|uniref:PI-PLC Y-box domain-containing protein n=1 Tax=Mytilus coruscus TaxID=42192 RepID=A0A6J8DLG4_MYTCO|nr:unnamed protein product [Mytilus coruscus]
MPKVILVCHESKYELGKVVILILVSTVSTEYDFKCPEELNRIIRANRYCETKEKNYSCLLDLQDGAYRESCLYKSDFVRMGQKYIIKGYRRNTNCSASRYQPFKFYSSQLSKCVFIKSSCSEEGQLIFSPGSTTNDRTCGCNYTEGCTFLVKPKSHRFCIPEQEDCTCYVTSCPKNNVLTFEYQCRQNPINSSEFPIIVKLKSEKNEAVTNEKFDSYRYNVTPPTISKEYERLDNWKTRFIHTCLYDSRCRTDFIKHLDKDNEETEDSESEESSKEIIEQGENIDMEGDETLKLIADTIDELDRVLSKLVNNKREPFRQIAKTTFNRRKEVLNLLKAVLEIIKNVTTNQIDIVEGVKLIQIILDTSNEISIEDMDCMQIPAVFLQHIWSIRVRRIKDDERLPDDLKSNIVKIRGKFVSLEKNINDTDCHCHNLSDVNEITVFVENLQKEIGFLINNKDIRTEAEVERVQHKSKEIINLYMNVQFLRSAYFIRYFSRETRCLCDKSNLMYCKLRDVEKSQTEFLNVFAQPTYDTVAFFSLFYPSDYNFITEYMKVKDVILQDLTHELHNKRFAMRPQKWVECWTVMANNPWGTVWSTNKPDDKQSLLFNFKTISSVDNTFLISSVRWPSWYVYMKDANSLRGQSEKTGPKREWKIVRLQDGKYMMCSKKWPCKFTFMKDAALGEVLAAYGNPGPSGYWDLIHENEIHLK